MNTMTNPSGSLQIPYGAAKLCQDMAILINNRQGSDVQFKIGGGGASTSQKDGENIYDVSAVTFYAHSVILRCRSRYFAAMLDEEKHWKESFDGVIYKPNISPGTFQDILHYIYTGNVCAKNSENIIELITAADEMDLEELSTKCQIELVRTVEHIFSNEVDSEEKTLEGSIRQHISIDVAIRTYIIPALNLTNGHSLSHLSHKLLTIILPRMSLIIHSPDAYSIFINEISSETLTKIIKSDDLAMTERSIWDLVLDWACYQTKLSKAAVEEHLSNTEDEEEEEEEESPSSTTISDTQFNQFKTILTPLLPAIRFSLLDPDDYYHISDILSYFLSRRRLTELSRFFVNPDLTGRLDMPRKKSSEQNIYSKIIVEPSLWDLLKKNILEIGGITGCSSLNHLKFKLLFRASEHGFLATTFHQRCDNRGPTLVLVKSADGHLFGGVNFNHWKSDDTYSISLLNFLFGLPDERHRKDFVTFRIKDKLHAKRSSYNHQNLGPSFGGKNDLSIKDSANTNEESFSYLSYCYNGGNESNTTLAGTQNFMVSDYEVFAIYKNNEL